MRLSLPVLLLLLLVRTPASAQAGPPADAPVARHVSHLLTLAGNGFASVRGQPTYGPGTSLGTTVLASGYAIRFQGADAPSDIRINSRWNVMHVTRLPVGRAEDVQGLWTAIADSIGQVLPAGWQRYRRPAESPREVSHAWWTECNNGGLALALQTHATYEAPSLLLIVYRYDAPCSN